MTKMYNLGDPEPVAEETDKGIFMTPHGVDVMEKECAEKADESIELAPMSIDEVYRLKFELEEKLLSLFMEFEARTNMTIRGVYPIVDEDTVTIEDVELEVVL